MKIKALKLNKPCSENWDGMLPNDDGRFCSACDKTVLDLTKLDQKEIFEKLKATKGNVCGKLTKSQLRAPYLDVKDQKQYKLPYSKAAAGIMLAATMASVQSCDYKETKIKTETLVYQISTNRDLGRKTIAREASKTKSTIVFSGKIVREDGSVVENAKITLVTLEKLYVTHSKVDGHFSMEIPMEELDEANVFRFEYGDIKKIGDNKRPSLDYLESEDLILTKSDMKTSLTVTASYAHSILGGIGFYDYEEANNPVVINEGKEVDFKEFSKARLGKKSSCNIKNKGYLYFEPEAAIAIYGEKAKFGLYLFSKDIKQ